MQMSLLMMIMLKLAWFFLLLLLPQSYVLELFLFNPFINASVRIGVASSQSHWPMTLSWELQCLGWMRAGIPKRTSSH